MCDRQAIPRSRIHGLTMPGFGTSQGTLENARKLMRELGITQFETDIRPTCLQLFRDLNHQPFGIPIGKQTVEEFQAAIEALHPKEHSDLVFENVQARTRTLLLMSRGFVLGTGDLSEQALGWSTYNGDHMSMYNVNCSIPRRSSNFWSVTLQSIILRGSYVAFYWLLLILRFLPSYCRYRQKGKSSSDRGYDRALRASRFFPVPFCSNRCLSRKNALFGGAGTVFSQL